MKLKLIMISLLAFGFAMSANAGSIVDTDGDLIPDVFDNCTNVANGPSGDPLNPNLFDQVDTDGDGIGNMCDADYDNNNVVDTIDFGVFFTDFLAGTGVHTDANSDGNVDTIDFGSFFTQFLAGVPGPPSL